MDGKTARLDHKIFIMTAMGNLIHLPLDIHVCIFHFLSPSDIIALRKVRDSLINLDYNPSESNNLIDPYRHVKLSAPQLPFGSYGSQR